MPKYDKEIIIFQYYKMRICIILTLLVCTSNASTFSDWLRDGEESIVFKSKDIVISARTEMTREICGYSMIVLKYECNRNYMNYISKCFNTYSEELYELDDMYIYVDNYHRCRLKLMLYNNNNKCNNHENSLITEFNAGKTSGYSIDCGDKPLYYPDTCNDCKVINYLKRSGYNVQCDTECSKKEIDNYILVQLFFLILFLIVLLIPGKKHEKISVHKEDSYSSHNKQKIKRVNIKRR